MTSASLASFFHRPPILESSNQNRPFFPFTIRNDSRNSIRTIGSAFEQGPAIVSSDNLHFHGSFVKPIQEVGGTEDVFGELVDDGVSSTEAEPKSQLPTRVKKKVQEDGDDIDNRFKLRNGREVCLFKTSFRLRMLLLWLGYCSLFSSKCGIQ